MFQTPQLINRLMKNSPDILPSQFTEEIQLLFHDSVDWMLSCLDKNKQYHTEHHQRRITQHANLLKFYFHRIGTAKSPDEVELYQQQLQFRYEVIAREYPLSNDLLDVFQQLTGSVAKKQQTQLKIRIKMLQSQQASLRVISAILFILCLLFSSTIVLSAILTIGLVMALMKSVKVSKALSSISQSYVDAKRLISALRSVDAICSFMPIMKE